MTVLDPELDPSASDAGSRTPPLVLAGLALTLVLWASAFVAIRYVDRHMGAGALALGRLAVGSLSLGALVLIRRERLPRGRALGLTVLCGVLWFGAYNLALNLGERRLDAGTSALLVNIGPIFLALLAGVVLGEGFPRRLLTGCAISFCGAGLIAAAVADNASTDLWGVILCVGAALAYAAGVVAQKPALAANSALSVTWVACTVGTLSLLAYSGSLVSGVTHAPAAAVLWMIYLGIAPTGIGFLCWAYVLSRWPAGRLGVITYLVPPLVVLLGWLVLGETPPWLAVPGGILCLAGVAWSRRR